MKESLLLDAFREAARDLAHVGRDEHAVQELLRYSRSVQTLWPESAEFEILYRASLQTAFGG